MLLFFGSFLLGRFAVAPETLFRILWDAIRESFCTLFGMQPPAAAYTGQERAVVLNIRLPRVALSALVGAGLSVAGTAYQGMFRNPMVSPDILGAMIPSTIAGWITQAFGSLGNMAGAAAMVEMPREWDGPWGLSEEAYW